MISSGLRPGDKHPGAGGRNITVPMQFAKIRRKSAVFLLLGLSGLSAACERPAASGASAAGRRGGGGPSVSVRTTTVQRMAVQRQVDLAGTLMSPDQARVSSEASGIVRGVLIEIGREVRAGDPLVRLETREAALAVERAESALRQTRAQLGM